MDNLKIIMCVDNTGGFSKDNKIPWIDSNGVNKFKEDFKHFKNTTKDSICIMGRNTYEDIVFVNNLRKKQITNEVLPKRKSYVISRNPDLKVIGANLEHSLRDVYNKEAGNNIFIIGGERLIIEALPFTNEVYLTIIDECYECDKFFPLKSLIKNFKIAQVDKKDNLYFVKYIKIK